MLLARQLRREENGELQLRLDEKQKSIGISAFRLVPTLKHGGGCLGSISKKTRGLRFHRGEKLVKLRETRLQRNFHQ